VQTSIPVERAATPGPPAPPARTECALLRKWARRRAGADR